MYLWSALDASSWLDCPVERERELRKGRFSRSTVAELAIKLPVDLVALFCPPVASVRRNEIEIDQES